MEFHVSVLDKFSDQIATPGNPRLLTRSSLRCIVVSVSYHPTSYPSGLGYFTYMTPNLLSHCPLALWSVNTVFTSGAAIDSLVTLPSSCTYQNLA